MNSVLEDLVRAGTQCPEKTAFADLERSISYGCLLENARRVGAYVAKQGGCKPVAVWARRDIFTPVLFYGAVWGGGYYVPLDPGLPAQKLQKILEDCNPELLLTAEPDPLPEGVGFSGRVVPLERLLQEEGPCPDPGDDPDQPLYMVYTSGSTGRPKGVLKSHGAVISFLDAYTATFGFSPEEVIGNQTPFCFDASAKDLYLALRLGATVEILDTALFSFPVRLVEHMNRRKVSFISWVPSALSLVSQLGTFSEVKPTTLKRVFFVGEVFPMKQLNRWRQALPEVEFVNLYGSSELAGICCYYRVEGTFADTQSLPMGGPLGNCRVYLVQEGRVITQPGQIGELYVASPALALGYYGDAERTAASFFEAELVPGRRERVFRTGDLAQYTPEGLLVFAARRDHQIKHMGHRIELGEIETAAMALEEVAKCCCVYHGQKSKLVLFCQLVPGCTATGRDILRQLKGMLSAYMVPNRVTILEQIPLNPNGKIDRPALARRLEEK